MNRISNMNTPRPIIVIESPYAGDVSLYENYARRAMHDSLMRGEAPFASHLLYTQVLQDGISAEREMGIMAGFAFHAVANKIVFYVDYGWSPGMNAAKKYCEKKARSYETRFIGR